MKISIVKKSQLYFILSFAVMIAGGTLLLKLPGMYRSGTLGWLDALFMATSSVCVTGLTTVNVCDFTFPGQFILALLMQLGGLGIMTLTASILVLLGYKMSFGDTLIFSTISDRFTISGTERLNRMVLNYTLFVEGVIALLALPGFMVQGYKFPEALWMSVFHSIAAFCNSGMSPRPENLVGCIPWVKIVLSAGIILGGLGIYVVYDCFFALRTRRRLLTQTRIILFGTIFLIVAGTVALWSFQRSSGSPMSWLDSFFLSVAARTAGFNNVPMSTLDNGSISILIVLMLIGGAPGSTAGGMKVTTVFLVLAAIYNTFKGNSQILISKREVPHENVMKAFSLIVTFTLVAGLGGVVIESLTPCPTAQWAFFESASALGTVGLSLDNPVPLTDKAKLFITFYMFIGRVGLFTVFLFLLGSERKSRLAYPEERIIIG